MFKWAGVRWGGKENYGSGRGFPGSSVVKNKQTNKQKTTLVPWKESFDKSGQRIKKQRHQFADKVL